MRSCKKAIEEREGREPAKLKSADGCARKATPHLGSNRVRAQDAVKTVHEFESGRRSLPCSSQARHCAADDVDIWRFVFNTSSEPRHPYEACGLWQFQKV